MQLDMQHARWQGIQGETITPQLGFDPAAISIKPTVTLQTCLVDSIAFAVQHVTRLMCDETIRAGEIRGLLNASSGMLKCCAPREVPRRLASRCIATTCSCARKACYMSGGTWAAEAEISLNFLLRNMKSKDRIQNSHSLQAICPQSARSN